MVDGPEKLTAIVPVTLFFLSWTKKRRADIAARSVCVFFFIPFGFGSGRDEQSLSQECLALQAAAASCVEHISKHPSQSNARCPESPQLLASALAMHVTVGVSNIQGRREPSPLSGHA